MPAVQSGSNSNTYALQIGGVSYLGSAEVSSIRWSESGAEFPAQFSCTLELSALTNQDFPGQEIALRDLTNSRKLFGGIVMSARRYHGAGPMVYYDIEADSYDALLDRYSIVRWRSVINLTAKRVRAMDSDREMIQSLAAEGYLYDLTANNTNVASTNSSMPKLTLTSLTARDAIQTIAEAAASVSDQNPRRFYVDFDKKLHYFKSSEGTSAPYRIGDASYTDTVKGTSGLVSLWSFSEASDATAYDAMGYANATLAGGYTRNVAGGVVNEPQKRATTFNGSSAQATASGASLGPGDTFSLECWFKRTASGSAIETLFVTSAGGYQLYFSATNKIILHKTGTGANFTSTPSYTDTNWHHLVVARSPGTTVLYIDGASVAGSTVARTFTTTSSLYLGSGNGVQYFNGTLQNAAIYNTALSAATALAHYNAGVTVVPEYIDFEKDVTDTAKKVYIKGGNKAGTDWVAKSTGRPYDRIDIIDQPESDSAAACKAFGASYLNREGAVVQGGKFVVIGYDGWRAGQTVAISDTGLGISGNYEIRQIEANPNMGNGKTTYEIAYGTLPYRATQMLTRKKKAVESTGRRSRGGGGGGGSNDDSGTGTDPGTGGGCFVAGTMILVPGGEKPIEDIAVGDAVLTLKGIGRVMELRNRAANTTPRVSVTLEDGRQIEATDGHPFWTGTEWQAIGEYRPGDVVFDATLGEHVRITSMAWLGNDPTDVFNFEVEPQHSYLVAGGIVVHNITFLG